MDPESTNNQAGQSEAQRANTVPADPWAGSAGLPSRPHPDSELVQQLDVQQVQLEMQNEELRLTQERLAQACDHYAQLYDFSPAGYMTLSEEGNIQEANLRFCSMLAVQRHMVVGRRLADFVAPQDWDVLARHCADVQMAGKGIRTCKLRFLPRTGLPLKVHVESMIVVDQMKMTSNIQMALLDITIMERAEQAVHESERRVQQTAAKLMTAQDDERRRIAQRLHDDYCQRLAALILEVGLLPRRHPSAWSHPEKILQPVKAGLSSLLVDLRDLSHNLHPNQTAAIALDEAIRTYVACFTEKTKIETTFHAILPPVRLSPTINTCLYRIMEEGLTNVGRHAKARTATVTMKSLPHAIELLIKDDGQGFDPEVSGIHHLGLSNIRQRAEHLAGTLAIHTKPGNGTTLTIQIPLP